MTSHRTTIRSSNGVDLIKATFLGADFTAYAVRNNKTLETITAKDLADTHRFFDEQVANNQKSLKGRG